MSYVTVNLSQEQLKAVDEAAKATSSTREGVVSELVEAALAKNKKEPKREKK